METILKKWNMELHNAENSYFGILGALVVFQSCIGAIAGMYILANGANLSELIICASLTMAVNATGLAHAPVKWLINMSIVSVLINLLLSIVNHTAI